MKYIKLRSGRISKVDEEDFEKLSKYKWLENVKMNTSYAVASILSDDKKDRVHIKMHRIVMNAPKGMDVDHLNGNGLDNRKCNLRICTKSQNGMNKGILNRNTSGFKGIYRKHRKWIAQIGVNNKRIRIGSFNTPEEAYKAYCEAAIKYHGEFARLK